MTSLVLTALLGTHAALAVDVSVGAHAGVYHLNNKHELYNFRTGEPLSQPLTLAAGIRATLGITPWLEVEGEVDYGGEVIGDAQANLVGLRAGPRVVMRSVGNSPLDLHVTAGIGSLSVLGSRSLNGRDTDMTVHAGPGLALNTSTTVAVRADWRLLGTAHIGDSPVPSIQHLITAGIHVRLGQPTPSAVSIAAEAADRAEGHAAQAAEAQETAQRQTLVARDLGTEAQQAAEQQRRAEASEQAARAQHAALIANAAAGDAEQAAREAVLASSQARAAAEASGSPADRADAERASVAEQQALSAAGSARELATQAQQASASAQGLLDGLSQRPYATVSIGELQSMQADADQAGAAARAATEAAIAAAQAAEAAQQALDDLDLADLRFETGKAALTAASAKEVERVADIMATYDAVRRLRIEGHTDSSGSADSNLRLSQSRVDEVIRQLIVLGVQAERLEGEGFGETQPIADNSTPEGRQQNRRVTFTIVQ